jgi:murein DD-endopeptidase MepM/ murein hydrolase activator NlpD
VAGIRTIRSFFSYRPRFLTALCAFTVAFGCAAGVAFATEPVPGTDPSLDNAGTMLITPAPQVLRMGSLGQAVRDLQRELRRRGSRVVIDGSYGLGTKRAVQRLQKRFGMTASGVATAPFLARLGITVHQVAADSSTTTPVAFQGIVPTLIWPAAGPINSPFGTRWGRMHEGIDIGAKDGSPVVAAAAGTVTQAGWESGYGNLVVVDHGGGVSTAYAHLSEITVTDKQSVQPGEQVGNVGSTGHSTGPHLHFEVRLGEDPHDPLRYLPATSSGADVSVVITPEPATSPTAPTSTSNIPVPAPPPAP